MLERGIRVLWPYLKAMDPFWVAASFAAGLVCYAAIKRSLACMRVLTAFLVLYLCLVYTSTVLSRDTKAENRLSADTLVDLSQIATRRNHLSSVHHLKYFDARSRGSVPFFSVEE